MRNQHLKNYFRAVSPGRDTVMLRNVHTTAYGNYPCPRWETRIKKIEKQNGYNTVPGLKLKPDLDTRFFAIAIYAPRFPENHFVYITGIFLISNGSKAKSVTYFIEVVRMAVLKGSGLQLSKYTRQSWTALRCCLTPGLFKITRRQHSIFWGSRRHTTNQHLFGL